MAEQFSRPENKDDRPGFLESVKRAPAVSTAILLAGGVAGAGAEPPRPETREGNAAAVTPATKKYAVGGQEYVTLLRDLLSIPGVFQIDDGKDLKTYLSKRIDEVMPKPDAKEAEAAYMKNRQEWQNTLEDHIRWHEDYYANARVAEAVDMARKKGSTLIQLTASMQVRLELSLADPRNTWPLSALPEDRSEEGFEKAWKADQKIAAPVLYDQILKGTDKAARDMRTDDRAIAAAAENFIMTAGDEELRKRAHLLRVCLQTQRREAVLRGPAQNR